MTDLEKQHTMESFWTMIRNDPTNDANRLVFGDWCEEHGEMELAADLRGGSEKWLRDFVAHYCPQDYLDDVNDYYQKNPPSALQRIIDGDGPIKRGHYSQEMFYQDLLREALDPNGYFTARGVDLHGVYELEHDVNEFWRHIRVMTGVDASPEHRNSFGWSCSC